jgi:cobalt-zinc-cadmium resistance protein CzcA
MHKFIPSLVAFSLRNHVLVLFLSGLLVVTGIIATLHTPIEAHPDVTSTRARIITQWAGRSAEEVEKFITLPIIGINIRLR